MNKPESLGPFTERSGVTASGDLEILLRPPEIELSSEDRQAALEFAHELFSGVVRMSDSTIISAYTDAEEAKNLQEVRDFKAENQAEVFYAGYFNTTEGRKALARLGIQAGDKVEIVRQLSDVEAITSKTDSETRNNIAVDSHKWYVDNLAEQLAHESEADADYSDDDSVTINFDPEILLTKIEGLQRYRRFYRAVRRANIGQGTLAKTKDVLLSVYMERVNNQLALVYPYVMSLAGQLEQVSPTGQAKAWRERLDALLPIVRAEMPTFTRRLDLLRNGAANLGEPTFSPISLELSELADTYLRPEASDGKITLPEEIVEMLKNTPATAGQLKSIIEAVLEKWGLLSSGQAVWQDVRLRQGPADDGKWQVVLVPKSSKLDVAESKKIAKVGADQTRMLDNGLAVSAHESTHILQAEFDERLAEIIPLAKIKGRRTLNTMELGGILEERRLKEMLGQVRPTNFTYLRALEIKLQGGNRLQAARASYEADIAGKDLSPEELEKKRNSAARRIERIYRHGGQNSQPLDYSEQEQVFEALAGLTPEQVKAIAIAGASFSLADMAQLHRVGLLELPKAVDIDPAADVLEAFSKLYL